MLFHWIRTFRIIRVVEKKNSLRSQCTGKTRVIDNPLLRSREPMSRQTRTNNGLHTKNVNSSAQRVPSTPEENELTSLRKQKPPVSLDDEKGVGVMKRKGETGWETREDFYETRE